MKIVICGSASFVGEMKDIKKKLQKMGHEVVLPHGISKFNLNSHDDAQRLKTSSNYIQKIKPELARLHFDEIKKGDAVLVINLEKHGIPNYIGGATFSEIMLAQYWGKKIFFLNPIPDHERIAVLRDELESTSPVVINGNLDLINASKP
jgi:hypothetical protein